jgi:dTDP-4-dehydrorhamnose 3,5-epimerase
VRVIETPLPGVVVIEPDVFRDDRGQFFESWNARRYAEAGIVDRFVQDNVSWSSAGVLRGLHFQHPHGQGKLVSVLDGEVFDVCVDLRLGSPTIGRWYGTTLSSQNRRQMMIPAGFAHGFVVTGSHALFSYKVTDHYHPDCDVTILWNDPDLAIEWPIRTPQVSGKDARGMRWRDVPPGRRPSVG